MSVQPVYSKINDADTTSVHRMRWQFIAISLITLVLLAIAYSPVMFNFFTSDDFYIISWLHSVKHNPLLLFQGVYEGTPYYRPLTNLVWFAEYLLCGTTSWGYRIIAIIYKILTATILGFLLAELLPSKNKSLSQPNPAINWSLFSAGLFLLYPLHTEPINWFVSTTEMLVNLFILSGFLFYLRWRRQKQIWLVIISCIFAICAFLSKETAVILPIILTVYEILQNICPTDSSNAITPNNHSEQRLGFLSIATATAPYWFLLTGYLLIRKLVTGNFLGSWNNTVFYFSNNQMMFKAWLQSLKTILVPISAVIFCHNNIAYYLWTIILITLASLTLRSFRKDHRLIALSLFIVIWFFVSLLPMLKLLLITSNLLNARYGYIASAPLCAFLMFGLAQTSNNKLANYGRYVLFFCILVFSAMILRSNNFAWAQAGRLTNSMRDDFAKIHAKVAGDPKIYFFNIPDQYKGVPINGIKTIESMNHIPFSNKNFDNGSWLLKLDKDEPEAFFYRWDMVDKHLHRMTN